MQRNQVLVLESCGKGVFTDISKVFEMKRLHWIIQVGPNCHHGALIRGRQRKI